MELWRWASATKDQGSLLHLCYQLSLGAIGRRYQINGLHSVLSCLHRLIDFKNKYPMRLFLKWNKTY